MLSKIPVVQLAVTLLSASVYSASGLPISIPLLTGIFFSSLLLLIWILFSKQKKNLQLLQSYRTILIHISAFTLFTVYASLNSDDRTYEFPKQAVTITGFVENTDRLTNGSASVKFRINKIKAEKEIGDIGLSLQFYIDSTLSSYFLMGYGYELDAVISPLPEPDNFDEFDYGKNLIKQNIHGIIIQKNITAIRFSEPDNSLLSTVVGWLRFKTEYAIITHIPDLLSQSIARGLILGFRSWIPDEVVNQFSLTGTMHVLSVSGLNVAFLTVLIFTPLIRLRKLFPVHGEAVRISVTILFLVGYGFITGWSIGIVRAALMSSIFLLSPLVKNKRSVWSSYSLALLLTLLYDPDQITEPGFLLSFTAVFGIILLSQKFKSTSGFMNGLAVSFTAIIFTTPITMIYFNSISIVGLLANIIIIPLTSLIFLFSGVMILVSPVSSALAGIYGLTVSFLTAISTESIRLLSQIPNSSVLIADSDYLIKSVMLSLPVLFVFTILKKLRFSVCVVLLLGLALPVYSLFDTPKSTVAFLYNGQGDCIAIKTRDNQFILIDAGPVKSESRKNSAVIRERMQRWGFSEISYLFITHPHLDHFGGVSDTTKPFAINKIILGDTVDAGNMFHALIRFYKNQGSEIVLVNSQLKINPSPNETIIALSLPYHDGNQNNKSLVVKYNSGQSSVLIMGDSELEQEHLFNKTLPVWFLKSDIFKVSHHGSRTSSNDSLIQKIDPEFAVISVGKINRYGLPDEEIIDKWHRLTSNVFELSKTGEVQFIFDGESVQNRKFRMSSDE